MSNKPTTGRSSVRPTITPLDVLRDRYAEADASLSVATDGPRQRIATLMALRAAIEFNRAAKPPIVSRTLCRHFDNLANLAITSRPDNSLRASVDRGLTTSTDQSVRNVWIAAAVKVLTEGGTSAKGMARDQAVRFVSTELNRLKAKDRHGFFSKERVSNIYLEIVRKGRAKGAHAAKNPMAVADDILRDRAKRLPHVLFSQHVMPDIRATVGAARFVMDLNARKRLARFLVGTAAQWMST
jgi:hypothetical protein